MVDTPRDTDNAETTIATKWHQTGQLLSYNIKHT